MGVVDNAIEDGVREGWVFDVLMPILDLQLREEDRGVFPEAIVDQVEQLPSVLLREWISEPFVDDQQVGLRQACHEARIRAVLAGNNEFTGQLRDLDVSGLELQLTRLVG